uniref:C-type lectin domain-containing protein n=1 Tax=Gadus morhua TaxID=8049 RepID=A0A8C5BJ39_GADMO
MFVKRKKACCVRTQAGIPRNPPQHINTHTLVCTVFFEVNTEPTRFFKIKPRNGKAGKISHENKLIRYAKLQYPYSKFLVSSPFPCLHLSLSCHNTPSSSSVRFMQPAPDSRISGVGKKTFSMSRYIYAINLNWANAQLYCQTDFIELASFSSSQDMDEIHKAVQGKTRAFWVGLYREDTNEASWRWSRGGNASNLHWGRDHPLSTGLSAGLRVWMVHECYEDWSKPCNWRCCSQYKRYS